jgi:hypothetical protein
MENSTSLASPERNTLKQVFTEVAPIAKNILGALLGATLIIIAFYKLTHR